MGKGDCGVCCGSSESGSGPLKIRNWQFTVARQGQATSWDTTEPKLGA